MSAVRSLFDGDGLPDPDGGDLPAYLAPLPRPLENLGLNLAALIALVNLAGTAFGFWYYRFQFALTDPLAWPLVPDSPVATLFIGVAFGLWWLGRPSEYANMLAFFGCLKLGLWTPFVQLVVNGPGGIAAWLYWFLILSHLAMAVEAFVIHRFSSFPVRAVAVAVAWYWFNDVVDYFVPVLGRVHHTLLRAEYTGVGYDHGLLAHDLAAAAAVTLTLLATFLALSTRVAKLRVRVQARD